MSSSHGPGTDMQMGLVPKRPARPCHGGTMDEALQKTMPIMPAARIFCAHHAQAPKWLDFKRAGELLRVGELAMREALPEVRKWLAAPVEKPVGAKFLPVIANPAPMPAD